jgi:phosphatidate cytidylyltransferase
MNNVARRLLLVFIGVPALFAIILLLDMWHFIGFNALIIIFSGLGAMETANIISEKLYSSRKVMALLIGIILPLAAYISLFPSAPLVLPVFFLFLSLSIILGYEIFNKTVNEEKLTIQRVAGYALILLYPGLFSAALVYLSFLPRAQIMIILFLTMVFSNDSFAYLFGMLLGKNNRNIFSVSPNKSIAGFIGALAGTTATAFVFSAIFKDLFPLPVLGPLLTAAVIFITATTGDLVESALKRAAGIKDSGTMIPGRGGVLDSIDSILFACPFFVFIIRFIYYISYTVRF